MGGALSYSYNVVLKQLHIPPQDATSKSSNDSHFTLSYIWTYYSESSIPFKAIFIFACILCVYGLYHYVYVPVIQDYMLAERCRFKLENTEPLKAGDNVVYTVSGFLPTVQVRSKDTEEYTRQFFNALFIKVRFNDERVPVMKAFSDEDTGRIKIIFSVEKSGTYNIVLQYNGFLIPGSPLEITIPPDSMCADSTEMVLPCVPLLLTDGMPQTIEIYPKDRTGFPCSPEGVRLDKFDFHASTEKACCNARLCGKMCELIGGFWKEGLDASFTYGGSSIADNQTTPQPITVMLNLRTNRSPNSYGMFEGQVCYDGHIVKCFPIVSLSCEEYERLEPTLKEPKPTDIIQLKAELLQPICEESKDTDPHSFMEWFPKKAAEYKVAETLKEVHLNISMKFICVKEVVWTVILSRTALFSIQGGTKIEAVPETDDKKRYVVTISDETGNEIRLLMFASSTRMLMALFLKFRANSEGTEITFLEKSNSLFESLQIHCEKLRAFRRETFELLNISRPDVLRTSFQETKGFERGQWYNPFIVSFLREPLLEDDAAWLEWAELLLDTVLENNPNGMFHKVSEMSGFIHPNPSRNFRRWSVQYYELTGKVIGKYLVERAANTRTLNYRVKVRFSRSFLLQLIGSPPTAHSLERDMPEVYESTVKTLTKSNFDDGVLTFCVPLYDSFGKLDQMIPLMENGEQMLVTNDNAELYLNTLARYHLSQKVSREIAAFRAGFTFIVPEDLLLNFDENELELLMCGWSQLDLSDLKKHHEIVGEKWHPEFPRVLKWFWTALDNMPPVEQAQFLQFSTGSSILPLGGFSQLQPRFCFSMTCLYGQLPVADPSSHSVCFSDHPDFEAFNLALLTAIRSSSCCQDKPNKMECTIHNEHMKIDNNNSSVI